MSHPTQEGGRCHFGATAQSSLQPLPLVDAGPRPPGPYSPTEIAPLSYAKLTAVLLTFYKKEYSHHREPFQLHVHTHTLAMPNLVLALYVKRKDRNDLFTSSRGICIISQYFSSFIMGPDYMKTLRVYGSVLLVSGNPHVSWSHSSACLYPTLRPAGQSGTRP